jgi:hypothetical protein
MKVRYGTRRKTKPELILLLEAVANGRTDLSLKNFRVEQIRWAIETGLGPLLFHSIQQRSDNSAFASWDLLRAADLTARVLMANHLEAMAEIIDACRERAVPITLLKGISIGEEFYPEAHLRVMRDIDFLVAKECVPAVEAILHEQGYKQYSQRFADHHNMPFLHEEKGVWVEVHHALFSGLQSAAMAKVFHIGNILAELQPSRFQGREVVRLSTELQLVYLACHWAQTFQPIGGAIALVDATYLLTRARDALRWSRILNWVDGCLAATYLYLLLSYLDRYRLVKIAPQLMDQLFRSQPSLGRLSLKSAHAIIDRYLIRGTDFSPLLTIRNVDIVWQMLTLPDPFLRKLIVRRLTRAFVGGF